MFDNHTANMIGNYVYRLIDPRNGETFYVGQGAGNRVFDHVKEHARSTSEDEVDAQSLKLERICEIHNEGLEVGYAIHRHGIAPTAIDEVEAALIDAFPGLTNAQSGIGSNERGPMSPKQLQGLYSLEELELSDEKLIFLSIPNIQRRSTPQEILDFCCLAWRVDVNRAKQADYVVPVIQKRIVGVFEPTDWLRATHDNFPGLLTVQTQKENRWGFVARHVSDETWARFVGEHGKRLPAVASFGSGNPIRYWNL